MSDLYFPDYDDIDFNRILNKYEFKEQENRNFLYQDPRQLLLRNLISKNTIYDNILLYWSTGAGKTAAAITIAEGFKEYVINMGRKILVLVKNGNIEKNFRNELLSEITKNTYTLDEDDMEPSNLSQAQTMNKINRKINKIYNFMTYGTFVNQVLGIKEFEKDEFGRNTTKQKRNVDGSFSRKKPINAIKNLNNTVIIIDEAHNITNNDVYIALSKVLPVSYNYRLVLLTATPMYDNPKEIIELSNILNMNKPENILPIRNDLFKPAQTNSQSLMTKDISKYLSSTVLKSGLTHITDLGMEKLKKTLLGKVSYLQLNTETFPDKIDKGVPLLDRKGSVNVVYCYMSEYQNDIYQNALKTDSRENINVNDKVEELDAEDNIEEYTSIAKSSSLYKNSSDASTMTYPNNLYGKDGFTQCFNENGTVNPAYINAFKLDGELKKYSAKMAKLLENINNSKGTVFIYSNYVNYGGTSLIKYILLQNGYTQFKSKNKDSAQYKSFILYDDSTNVETRETQRRIFNSEENKHGKYIKIIIGSPVISEGITLKNVRQVHILEPSWNMSRINQIIGRAIRHHSHDSLPQDERNVEIYKYCSIYESNKKTLYFIDKEKYILAEEKDRVNKKIERLLKQLSLDCNINTSNTNNTNIQTQDNSDKDGTPECDYVDCKYTCLINPVNKQLDKFTYKLYINFFEEFDIEICISFIKELFKKYFIWSVPDIISWIKNLQSMISDESIYTALKQLIISKIIILDQFDREGFLIQKGDYIIFNPVDIDIHSSIYSKMLDFNINFNKFDINEYINKNMDTLSTKYPNLKKDVGKSIDEKDSKHKTTITEDEPVILSAKDLEFNNNIIENNKVYGSYRKRPSKISGSDYGPKDNILRIIDIRDINIDVGDQRKNITGMVATSYKKPKLISIIEYLSITNEQIKQYLKFTGNNIDINKLSSGQLITIIEKHLIKQNLILK